MLLAFRPRGVHALQRAPQRRRVHVAPRGNAHPSGRRPGPASRPAKPSSSSTLDGRQGLPCHACRLRSSTLFTPSKARKDTVAPSAPDRSCPPGRSASSARAWGGGLRHTQNSRTSLAQMPRRLQSWRSMASKAGAGVSTVLKFLARALGADHPVPLRVKEGLVRELQDGAARVSQRGLRHLLLREVRRCLVARYSQYLLRKKLSAGALRFCPLRSRMQSLGPCWEAAGPGGSSSGQLPVRAQERA